MKTRFFYPLFFTQFLGAFNDNLLKNALVIAVTIESAHVFGFPSDQAVALAGGLFILPFFLFSAIAGEISDRYDKSRVLQATKILEIIVMLFSAWALWIKNYDFLMVTLFFMGLQSTFFGPAKFSILPQHLPEKQLMTANAWVEAATFMAILLGTILGGILISIESGNLFVAGTLLFISVIGYLTSLWIPLAPASNPNLILQKNPLISTWQQFRYSLKNRDVFMAMMAGSWFWFVGAFILSLLPIFCLRYLNADEKLMTSYLVVFSVGVGVGSFLSSYLSKRYRAMNVVMIGAGIMTVALLALVFVGPQILASGFLLFLLSLGAGLYIVPLNTFIQEKSDLQVRSQVIAAYNISNSFFMVLSSLFLMALLALKISFSIIFLLLFCLSLAVFWALWAYLFRLQQVHR